MRLLSPLYTLFTLQTIDYYTYFIDLLFDKQLLLSIDYYFDTERAGKQYNLLLPYAWAKINTIIEL